MITLTRLEKIILGKILFTFQDGILPSILFTNPNLDHYSLISDILFQTPYTLLIQFKEMMKPELN